MGNPALDPLLPFGEDLLIVEVNALARTSVPRKAADIAGRLDEIAFNSALVQEIRGIENINKLVRAGSLTDRRYRLIRFHTIAADPRMTSLDATTKYRTDLRFLRELHDLGYAAAAAWLADPQRYGAVGVRSSIDVKRRYCDRARGEETAGSVARTSSRSSISASGHQP
jgi:NTE family protein